MIVQSSPIYRLIDESEVFPLINWRYTPKLKTYHSLKGIEHSYDNNFFSTEHEVISFWINHLKKEISSQPQFKKSTCWAGHFDLFGLTMLNLAKMSKQRTNGRGKWSQLLEEVIPKNLYIEILSGRINDYTRTSHITWMKLIGHPLFQSQSLLSMHLVEEKLDELRLVISFYDLNRNLTKKIF